MPLETRLDQPWTRKHDLPATPYVPHAAKIHYPASLEELIDICKSRAPNERLKAAGSHWALSEAAVSDHTFIETHDPNDLLPAMGHTLHDVFPKCLHPEVLDRFGQDPTPNTTFIHVEAGKRIYQLYAELDQVDGLSDPRTFASYINDKYSNPAYQGPWAFETLGGAGGQTVVGALTTGTHGGDWRQPPIADSVVALHLVTDGGKHYWIEATGEPFIPQMTDDDKLNELYGAQKYGGPANFEIIRGNDVLNAVLVSVGRFGIIYSVVLRAESHYALHEERRLTTWQDVKGKIGNLSSDLYRKTGSPTTSSRFLQIAVCLTPHANFTRNLAGVTKRWNDLDRPQRTAGGIRRRRPARAAG
jgi:hypothetical protein